jgi:flagellar hook-basal body complex protein FliE
VSGIEPIGAAALQPLASVFPTDEVAPTATVQGADATGGFSQLVTQGLTQVNEKLLANQTSLQRLATGDTQNVHQVMIQLEESRLSFQLMMQVRGRLLEAYQDVMKMQI